MGCASLEEIEDLVLGTLSPGRQAAVAAHVETCPACASERSGLQRERDLFTRRAEVGVAAPPPTFAILLAASGAPRASFATARWLAHLGTDRGWMAVAAAALLLVGLSRQNAQGGPSPCATSSEACTPEATEPPFAPMPTGEEEPLACVSGEGPTCRWLAPTSLVDVPVDSSVCGGSAEGPLASGLDVTSFASRQ